MRPEEIVATIIRDYMQLAPSRVVFYAQNFQAPKDSGIYVIVSLRNRNVIGVSTRIDDDENEVASTTMRANIDVDIVSKNRDAAERSHEAILATESVIGQQIMNAEGARVFREGGLADLTAIEASSALHRYRVSFIVHYTREAVRSVDLYDKFRTTATEVEA